MAASLGNAVGVVGGYSKWREGRRMQRAAQEAIDNFDWQDLENPYKDMQVSTMGADLRAEEMGRVSASAIDAARAAGARGIAAGIGRVMQANVQAGREIAANLDEQNAARSMAIAAQEAQNQATIERRQAEELQGYGQKLNVGMNMKYGGAADIMNAAQSQGQTNMSIMSMVGGMMGGGMGGGMMGGGSSQSPVTAPYGSGLPSTQYGGTY